MDATQAENQDVQQDDDHSTEEWRALGSAEANAWTITPPGGQAMTLDAHATAQADKKARLQAMADFDRADDEMRKNAPD